MKKLFFATILCSAFFSIAAFASSQFTIVEPSNGQTYTYTWEREGSFIKYTVDRSSSHPLQKWLNSGFDDNCGAIRATGTDDMILNLIHLTTLSKESDCSLANCDTLAKEICQKVGITDNMSDYEKVRRAHDYLCDNRDYNSQATTVTGEKINNYVCGRYANEFGVIMAAAGVKVEKRGGTADNGKTTGLHDWNRVWLDGEWKYIDVTWDDTTNTNDYFLISYDQMAMDHNDALGSGDYNHFK